MSYIITIIVNPNKSNLEASVISDLCAAWSGCNIKVLNKNVAAEFVVESIPRDFEEVWASLNGSGIDLVIQPNCNRKKKLLVADMDSTIIEQECLDELADLSGYGEKVREITKRAMNGEIQFDQALEERVALLAGMHVKILEKTWTNRITFTPGAKKLLGTMRANNAYCVLVSGGFTAFTERVAKVLGFHETHANSLIIENGRLSGKVGYPILDKDAKLATLDILVTRLNITYEETVAVGDGANDLHMLTAAGLGVAFRSYPIVAQQSKVRINHGDLTSLLYLQGFCSEDFEDHCND